MKRELNILVTRKNSICEIVEGLKVPKRYCFYILQLGEEKERYFKIGMTDCLDRRMYEHLGNKAYEGRDIVVLFVKSSASKYSAERIEDNVREELKKIGFTYVRNDRFYIPKNITEIIVKVRKEYKVAI